MCERSRGNRTYHIAYKKGDLRLLQQCPGTATTLDSSNPRRMYVEHLAFERRVWPAGFNNVPGLEFLANIVER